MSVIFFMIGVSLCMALGFLGAFIWSMRTGQQDDLYTPSLRMLTDDTLLDEPTASPTNALLNKPVSSDPTCRPVSQKSATAV